MVLYLLLLSAIFAIAVLRLVVKQWRLAQSLSAIPTLKSDYPLQYTFWCLMADFKDYYKVSQVFFERVRNADQGPIVKCWLFHMPIILTRSPKAFEEILKSNAAINRSFIYDSMEPWLGTGILLSKGRLWHSRRKLFTPTLHFRILENFLPIFNEQSAILMDILQEKVEAAAFTSGSPHAVVEISHPITLFSLDVICATAMGKELHAQRDSNSEYAKAVGSISEHIMHLEFRPWLKVPFIFNMTSMKRKWDKDLKTMHDFACQVIEEKKAKLKERMESGVAGEPEVVEDNGLPVMGYKRRKAVLDTLLEAAASKQEGEFPLTDKDIRDEVDNFMFGGHDTTAAALTWILSFVGNEPEVQRKIQEELEGIFGDSLRPVEMQDFSKMNYIEAVAKESLRMIPLTNVMGRTLNADIEIDGITVPAGQHVFLCPLILHRNPLVFDDPLTFRPERFLHGKERESRHPFGFLGFSAGPRNCIGKKYAMLEMKVVLSSLFRRFHVTSVLPTDDIRKYPVVISRALEPVDVIFTPRDHAPPSSSPRP